MKLVVGAIAVAVVDMVVVVIIVFVSITVVVVPNCSFGTSTHPETKANNAIIVIILFII